MAQVAGIDTEGVKNQVPAYTKKPALASLTDAPAAAGGELQGLADILERGTSGKTAIPAGDRQDHLV